MWSVYESVFVYAYVVILLFFLTPSTSSMVQWLASPTTNLSSSDRFQAQYLKIKFIWMHKVFRYTFIQSTGQTIRWWEGIRGNGRELTFIFFQQEREFKIGLKPRIKSQTVLSSFFFSIKICLRLKCDENRRYLGFKP